MTADRTGGETATGFANSFSFKTPLRQGDYF